MNNHNEQNLQRFETAMDAIRRSVTVARDRFVTDLGLTRTQLEILLVLQGRATLTTTELARQLGLTQSAITQTVDTLARRGLVERQPDEHDRRIIHLRLSAASLKITEKVKALKRERMRVLFDQLGDDEVRALISATEKWAALLEGSDQTTNHK